MNKIYFKARIVCLNAKTLVILELEKKLTLKNEQIMSERYFRVKIHLNKATVNEFLINEAKIMNEVSVK